MVGLMNPWRLEVPTDDVGIIEPAAESVSFGERQAGKPLLGLFHRLGCFPGRDPVLVQQHSFQSLLPLFPPSMTAHGEPSGGGFGHVRLYQSRSRRAGFVRIPRRA